MANRSTRNKMRFQVEKAIAHVDKIFEHWRYLEELTGGESPHVNELLPVLVSALHEYREACVSFRESL